MISKWINKVIIRIAIGRRRDWFENYCVRETLFEVCNWIAFELKEETYYEIAHNGQFHGILIVFALIADVNLNLQCVEEEFNRQVYADIIKHVKLGTVCGRDWKLVLRGNSLRIVRVSDQPQLTPDQDNCKLASSTS